MIVARAYPGPGSGRRGRLPIDRKASFHATHVAGIAAGRSGDAAPGRARPPAGGEPHWGRAERLDRELPGLQRPDPRGLHGEHAGDRGRLRGCRPRRHGRDQLLRRRLGDRPCQRRADRGGEQRGRRRSRAGDRGRQRTRRLRPRQHRLAGLRARRDHRRGVVEPPRLRAVALGAGLGCAVDSAERPVRDLPPPAPPSPAGRHRTRHSSTWAR